MTGQHCLFLGDSITDAGHLWEEDPRLLGNGFVRKISEAEAFSSAHIVNRGQDGFTSGVFLFISALVVPLVAWGFCPF